MSENRFEEIEHTADWAIRVRARDLSALFEQAAIGMFSLLTDLSTVSAERQFSIDLQAVDVETLLIDWLNELLFLSEEHGLVFAHVAVVELRMADGAHLRVVADGGRPGVLHKVIKAATFGGLSITRPDDDYQAELVFDV